MHPTLQIKAGQAGNSPSVGHASIFPSFLCVSVGCLLFEVLVRGLVRSETGFILPSQNSKFYFRIWVRSAPSPHLRQPGEQPGNPHLLAVHSCLVPPRLWMDRGSLPAGECSRCDGTPLPRLGHGRLVSTVPPGSSQLACCTQANRSGPW